jgi:DNA-binding transcriptional LysR family regulator
MMNFKHLQTFVTICECGTVSRAAAQLRITQPALSRRIEALQNELGLRLFDAERVNDRCWHTFPPRPSVSSGA